MTQKRDKRKKNLGETIARQYKASLRKGILGVVYAVLTCALLAVGVLLEVMPRSYAVSVGEAATETIYAIAEVEDTDATAEAREKAREAVTDVFSANSTKTAEETTYFETIFAGFEEASGYGAEVRREFGEFGQYMPAYDTAKVRLFTENGLSFLTNVYGEEISPNVVKVIEAEPDEVAKLKKWFMPKLKAYLKDGISETQLDRTRSLLADDTRFSQATTDQNLKDILADTVQSLLYPNADVDEAATNKARDAAEKNVQAVYLPKGAAIVTKDEIVTQSQYDMLNRLGMLEEGGFYYLLAIGAVGMVIMLSALVFWYIFLFEKKVARQPKKILLLCLLTIVDVLIALALKSAGWEMTMSTAMCTILVAVFFNEQLAVVVNAALSVVLAMMMSKESDLFGAEGIALMLANFAGGTAAAYVCRYVRVASRSRMLVPGVISGIVASVTAFLVLCISGKSPETSGIAALFCLAGGAVAALLSAGSLSMWESAFNLLTQSKLLELSNSNSDLLRKISLEIPGTYQHSTTVAMLAENGAKDIGANAMLARAASLYHDIGKLRIPECYTENQTAESKNFHNTLSPKESANMIFSHITEGVKMAKDNKLPQEIIDVIQQHHGTSAVLYFYNKAKETDPETKLEDFRYPGPDPQTKEAGIILLADCVEASVRSMDEKTSENISAQIERMFKARMEDGELDECALSLKDINILKQSFANTLAAMYHTRIKYDNGEKKE